MFVPVTELIYFIGFSFVLENVDKGAICTIELDAQKVQQFANAIENSYWFELFIGMENPHLDLF
jgi:hypothetical protein